MSGTSISKWTLAKIHDEFYGTGIATIVLSILSVAILLYNIGWILVSRDRRMSMAGRIFVGFFSTMLILYATLLAIIVAGVYYYLENAENDFSTGLPQTIKMLWLLSSLAEAIAELWIFVFCYEMYRAHRPPYSHLGVSAFIIYGLFANGIPVLCKLLPCDGEKVGLLTFFCAYIASIIFHKLTPKIVERETKLDAAHKAHLESQRRMGKSIVYYHVGGSVVCVLVISLTIFAYYPNMEKTMIAVQRFFLIFLSSIGIILSLMFLWAFMPRTTASNNISEPTEPELGTIETYV